MMLERNRDNRLTKPFLEPKVISKKENRQSPA